jgi:ribose 5-phosphate isomerase B
LTGNKEDRLKIVVAADHGGFELKEMIKGALVAAGEDIVDVGCFSNESVDYPDFAKKATSLILKNECQMGILICGTGIGMSIAANRDQGIRAANCSNVYTAKMSREHNNANVLCLGARVLEADTAIEMVRVWLNTAFSGGRHQRRISKFGD